MRAFFSGIRYELKALRGAPAAILVLAGAALFYSLIYPGPYSTQMYRNMPIYALDMDNSSLSRELLTRINATEQLSITQSSGNPHAARLALQRGEVLGIIEIPENLQRDVLRGTSPAVGVFANAGFFLAYSEMANSASKAILQTGAELGAATDAARSGVPAEAAVTQMPFGISIRQLYDPAGGYATFVVPAVVVIILHQTLLIGLGLLCESRRLLPAAPQGWLPRTLWVIGRTAPWVFLYLVQFAIIRWGIFPLYKLPAVGTPGTILPFMALFLFAATLFGMLLAQLFKRSDDVIPLLLFTSLPVVFLSGFSWPTQMIPEPLQWLARLLPSTPGVQGFVNLDQLGSSFRDISGQLLNLLVLCAIFTGLLVFHSAPAGSASPGEARGKKSTAADQSL